MLVLNIFILLISLSQGSLRSASHYRDHDYTEPLLESNEDYESREDALLQVLDAFKEDEERYHRKRELSRMNQFEIYDDENDEDDDDEYDHELDYNDALESAYEDMKHSYLHHRLKNKKKAVRHKSHHTKKELHHKHSNKNRQESKKDFVAGNKEEKKELLDNNMKIVKEENQFDTQNLKKNVDNNQIASVKVDDTIEKQEEFIASINPREIFLEANANTTKNVSKSPTHAHVKGTKVTSNKQNKDGLDRLSFIAVIAGCCVAGLAGIILAGYCWFKLRQESKEKDILKPVNKKSSTGSVAKNGHEDAKMAQKAEEFHYQHAKKQMQQMDRPMKPVESRDDNSDDDDEEEDTVYECPGLAAPGDMRVVNPLFSDAESHHSDNQSQGETPPEEELPTVLPK